MYQYFEFRCLMLFFATSPSPIEDPHVPILPGELLCQLIDLILEQSSCPLLRKISSSNSNYSSITNQQQFYSLLHLNFFVLGISVAQWSSCLPRVREVVGSNLKHEVQLPLKIIFRATKLPALSDVLCRRVRVSLETLNTFGETHSAVKIDSLTFKQQEKTYTPTHHLSFFEKITNQINM